jgi:hypothetical protein
MRILHPLLTLALTLAVIALLMLWRKKELDLKQQLQMVTDANAVLKDTLGELTVAIARKEKEIDDLHKSCATRELPPNCRSVSSPKQYDKSSDPPSFRAN